MLHAMKGQVVWVRRFEHLVLRLVSLAFSLASAHAIRWFFAPLDKVDVLQPAITWTVAIGFGVLGYFVSRGLAHRLMNRERIRAYVPICLVDELVEIFCNYALAAVAMDLERSKHVGYGSSAGPALGGSRVPSYTPSFVPRPPVQPQPKAAPHTNGGVPPINIPPVPAYTQGYTGTPVAGSPFGAARPVVQVPTP